MRRMNGIGHFAHQAQLLLESQLVRDGVEGAAFDQLHRDERTPLLDARFVDAADAIVLDARLGPCFPQEP
jgi:hypothetical protein